MLNAVEPGTVVPIHRQPTKDESFVILRGKEARASGEGALEHPPRPDERQFPLFDQVSTKMQCVAVGPEEMKGQYRYEWNGVLIGIGLK